jgi:hypothetical protein
MLATEMAFRGRQPITTIESECTCDLLERTPLLDFDHPSIVALISERGWRDMAREDRVRAIYEFVRDEIVFGYNSDDDIPASAVLADGYGQCNTKATLFMALLRAVGISCRFHGFTIHKRLQKGAVTGLFYMLAPANILHSWVEVQFDGKWINLEGLILDTEYLRQLQAQNPDCSGSFCGFGVSTDNFRNPETEWTGRATYIQDKGINHDFGLFNTPDEFYVKIGTNIRGWKKWFYIYYIRHVMNRNVARIRNAIIR